MATQQVTPECRPASGSLIRALHARYEQAFDEYNRLEEASLKLNRTDPADRRIDNRYTDGMRDSSEETDQLRIALLWQVPEDLNDATLIAYHLWSLWEAEPSLTEVENKAFEVGMNSLFDMLVGEGCADMERTGPIFQQGAMLAFNRRRSRTGYIEGDD